MVGFSNAQETMVLSAYFKGASWSPPNGTWLGLCTALPNDDGTGIIEVNYAGATAYARQQILTSEWGTASAADPSTLANSQTIQFPLCQEAYSATATHFILMDAQTSGNMLFSGTVTIPSGGLPIANGTQPQVDPGALIVTLD